MTNATVEKPAAEAKASRKVKAEKAPKAPRRTLTGLLWNLFAANSKPETIVKTVARDFPDSEFNVPEKTDFHMRYYLSKYNAQARKEGRVISGTVLAKKERVRKAKAVKADAPVAA